MRPALLSRLGAAALFGALTLFAPAAWADAPPRTIAVSGQGSASGVPDRAQLSAGVSTVSPTADEALAENARKMSAVFAALKKLGVPDKAVQTSNFSVSPQYADASSGGRTRIAGYEVSNQVDVLLHDTTKLGPTLDALVAAGANQINSVSFSINDAAALMEGARKAAIADAQQRAQTYAAAANASVGAVVSIQEGGSGAVQNNFRDLQFHLPGASSTPTAAGEQSVTASVVVVFELK